MHLVIMEQIDNAELKTNPTTTSGIPAEMENIKHAKKKRRSILKVPIITSSEREALKVRLYNDIKFMANHKIPRFRTIEKI